MNDAFRKPTIEFWFEFGSNYSYLSVMRIEAEAARRGISVTWKPFLLGPIFKSLGFDNSPFVLQKEKGAYMWQDMVRQCRKHGVPWRRPSVFPRLGVLPLRVALAGEGEAWVGAFCQQVMLRNFAEDQDINGDADLLPILAALGLPAVDILARAGSETIKARLRANTEEAGARGVFGAPTFFVGNEMFWGNDRLDDALDLAAGLLPTQPRPA